MFVKTGVFSIETAKEVSLILEMWQSVDYDFEYCLNDDEAEMAVKIAHNFVELVLGYFK